jgi:hypothetical protein
MNQRFSDAQRASLEMPAQLAITMMIVAVTASAGFGALSTYSRTMVDSGLRQQAQGVAAAAARLDTMGINSSLETSVRLDNAPLEKMAYFRIGHPLTRPLHPYSSMVRFKAASTEEGHVYVRDAGGNPLPLCSETGGTVELGAGTHRILLILMYDDTLGAAYVRVEVETG